MPPKKKNSTAKKNTPTKNQTANWNQSDDKKLKALFDNNILCPIDLNSATIHEVIGDHFPKRSYKSFLVLYKRKAREYNVAISKFGVRQGKNTNVLFFTLVRSFTHLLFPSCYN